jgi:purine nucleoside permease
LVNSISGGFVPATQNLYHVGGPLIADIVANWGAWKEAVPE